jgi:hypothetical protein
MIEERNVPPFFLEGEKGRGTRLRRARRSGFPQRGRVDRPACFQSFSHCQMPYMALWVR